MLSYADAQLSPEGLHFSNLHKDPEVDHGQSPVDRDRVESPARDPHVGDVATQNAPATRVANATRVFLIQS